mmetsp:Transcript_69581/g.163503  ORF Transcript_69581/g.163503 Transcript_69581/m.163503 type:complete len:129 (+) Transcript_69581:667-1053(+)
MVRMTARGTALNADDSLRPDAGISPGALLALARLQPELEGYPLEPLLDACACAEAHERQRAFLVVDCCLSHWIAQLDQPVPRVCNGMPDLIDRIERRQQGDRAALARVYAALSRARPAAAPCGESPSH